MWGISGGPVIVGWAYEATIHCKDCGLRRFGAALFDGTARDEEGNEPTPIYSYEQDASELCDDCLQYLDGVGPAEYSAGCDEDDEDLDEDEDDEVVGILIVETPFDPECPICRLMAGW